MTGSLDALSVASEAAFEYVRTSHSRRVAPEPAALAAIARLTEPLGADPTDPADVVRELHRRLSRVS